MLRTFGIVTIMTALVACTPAEKKEMQASDAMEDKARQYCGVDQAFDIDGKEYSACHRHYMQGLMDASK